MKEHLRTLANSLGKFAQQTLLPRESAATVSGVVRPPNYMGPSKTCAAHTKGANVGNYADAVTDGVWTGNTVRGEAWAMLSPSIGNMLQMTYGDVLVVQSSLSMFNMCGRFRSSIRTLKIGGPAIEYKSARPLRTGNDTSLVIHARPDNQGQWVYPIITNVVATALEFRFTFSRVLANDPVFAESLNLKFYYRNQTTGVWSSITTTGAVDAFNGSAVITVTVPATININGWFFTMVAAPGADISFDFNIDVQSDNPGTGITFGLPRVANVMKIMPNPLLGITDAGWAVERAAFVSGAMDLNCTASDLDNGGKVTAARLLAGQYPTEFGDDDILSTTPTAYDGKFRDGCYAWLLPDLSTYCQKDSNHVEFDQCLFFILQAEKRGSYQIIYDFIMQGSSVSPLYEYRSPTVIPNFQVLIDQLRELPACTDNSDHLAFFKKMVDDLVKVVGSEGFAQALELGDKALKALPGGRVVSTVGHAAIGAGKGIHTAVKHAKGTAPTAAPTDLSKIRITVPNRRPRPKQPQPKKKKQPAAKK